MKTLRLYWKYNWYLWAILAVFVSLLMYVQLGDSPVVANAAPGGDTDNCELVSEVAVFKVWYCEPTMGQPYLLNSVGFMLSAE